MKHSRCLVALLPFVCLTPPVQAADPAPSSPEQEVLDKFTGTWRTEYQLPRAEWTPVEKAGAANLTYRRVLGGEFVQEQSEHADGTTGLVMYTYDAGRKCYRIWWFSSTGQTSEATGQWDAGTATFTWTLAARAEQEFTTVARHRFVDDDTFQWDVVSKDGKGKVLFRMEGKATRTGSS